MFCFFSDLAPAHHPPTHVLSAPLATITDSHAPPRLPLHLLPEELTAPVPGCHRITGKTTTGTFIARVQPRAATAASSEEEGDPHESRPSRERRTLPAIRTLTTDRWTESATYSGRGSTESGTRNTLAATPATSTTSPHHLLLLLLLRRMAE